MIPCLHYDPENTTKYMADKTTVRLLFATASHRLHIEHIEIEAAYLHDKFAHNGRKPLYVRQYPRFDGSLKHPCRAGRLEKNLYGTPSAGYNCLTGIFNTLTAHKFRQSEADLCLFHRSQNGNTTFVAISMDDFTVVATTKHLLEKFANILAASYKIKRLGKHKTFLGWTVRRTKDGDIHVSQPNAIQYVVEKAAMVESNGNPTPYNDSIKPHGPIEQYEHTPALTKQYQTILREIHYIGYSTRPNIYFVTNRLSFASKTPTKRHWLARKPLICYLKATSTRGIHFKAGNHPSPPHAPTPFPNPPKPSFYPTGTLISRQTSKNASSYLAWCTHTTVPPYAGT